MTETIAFPLWASAVAAAVMALLAILAALRIGGRQVLALLVAAVFVMGIGWLVVERLDTQEKLDRRRVIEARVAALSAQALAPNSNLACLDAAGGEIVHEACEKALFAGPEQVAAALNYVSARLDLLREIATLSGKDDTELDTVRTPILRSLEADRFGFVAQVLMARDGCGPASCYAFDLLPQNRQVISNMSERSYDARVARFAAAWGADKPDKPAGPALASQVPQTPPAQSSLNVSFPSASSIPPVSIMSNEPGRPGQNGVEVPARSEPAKPERPQAAPPPPPRRPAQKAQAPRREPPPAAPPPAVAADPFPQPVGAGQQTTGAQPQ